MLRDNLVGLIEPMGNSAGVDPLALVHCPIKSHRTIDPQCLENPRPEGAESTLSENARSPFQAEPRHLDSVPHCAVYAESFHAIIKSTLNSRYAICLMD